MLYNKGSIFLFRYTQRLVYTGLPWLLETLEKHGIYFGSFNPGNSMDFYVKSLNLFEICVKYIS